MNQDFKLPFESEEESTGGFTMRDGLYIIFRHKWKMLLVFLLISAGGIGFVYMMPNIYQSSAQILIKFRDPTRTGDRSGPSLANPSVNSMNALQTEMGIMSSPYVRERVVDRLDLVTFFENRLKEKGKWDPENPPSREKLKRAVVGWMGESMEFDMMGDTIVANFFAEEPEVAQKVLNEILEVYAQRRIELYKSPVRPEFYAERFEEVESELSELRSEMKLFRAEHNITSLQDQQTRVLSNLGEVQAALRETNSQISASQAMIEDYRRQLSESRREIQTSVAPVESPEIQRLQDQIFALEAERDDLLTKYPENARPVQDVLDKLAVAQSALQREIARQQSQPEVATAVNEDYRQTESLLKAEQVNLTGLRARRAALEKDLAVAQGEKTALMRIADQLARMENKEQVLEAELAQRRDSLQRSRTLEQWDQEGVANMVVQQSPTLGTRPVRPQKTRNYAAALMAALVAALGLAFGLEYLNHSFRTSDDVEKHLGVPVLTTISIEEFKSCI